MTDRKAQALLDGWKLGNVLAADCPSRIILNHLTNRWGALVMVALATGPHRFAALRRKVGGVSERMLTQQLRELEDDGIVHREVYPEVPPKVEYSLTEYGKTLRPITKVMCEWGQKHMKRIKAGKK